MNYIDFINNIINIRGQWSESITHKYFEKHHITPKCIGGEDDKNNIIWLTPQEHYEAHKLLALENPDILSLTLAWNAMSHWKKGRRNLKISAEEYKEKQEKFSNAVSIMQQGENNSFYGKHHNDETKAKISISSKGRVYSAEDCEKRRERQTGEGNSFYGHKHTEESLDKIRKASQQNWAKNKEQMIEHMKSLHLKWWNNGENEVKSKDCPEGYKAGRLTYNKHWYTNDVEEIKSAECPEGWHRGRSQITKNKIKTTQNEKEIV